MVVENEQGEVVREFMKVSSFLRAGVYSVYNIVDNFLDFVDPWEELWSKLTPFAHRLRRRPGHRLDQSVQKYARDVSLPHAFGLRRHGANHDGETAQSSQRDRMELEKSQHPLLGDRLNFRYGSTDRQIVTLCELCSCISVLKQIRRTSPRA